METFAVQTLYDKYGRELYARAAADPAFSAAISELAAAIRHELEQEGPRVAKLLTRKQNLNSYLQGHSHALLACLLEAALRPDADTLAATDPDFAAVRLGALFHLAFDGGLLQLPAQTSQALPDLRGEGHGRPVRHRDASVPGLPGHVPPDRRQDAHPVERGRRDRRTGPRRRLPGQPRVKVATAKGTPCLRAR
ncbi:DUF6401 family natural product biosynthesis protein [Nonomuraea sp. NPDC003804]|uniref:DUF6401 family natural product biosynthesis protein n=1 Tax=Nonomuraea sp. NPDC003804 TaxID=3154547 RepID=UPI0033A4BB11